MCNPLTNVCGSLVLGVRNGMSTRHKFGNFTQKAKLHTIYNLYIKLNFCTTSPYPANFPFHKRFCPTTDAGNVALLTPTGTAAANETSGGSPPIWQPPAVHTSSERKWVDIEIGLRVIILIAVDELHHLVVGAFSLFNAHSGAPFPDGI